jgi:hypothetical protein
VNFQDLADGKSLVNLMGIVITVMAVRLVVYISLAICCITELHEVGAHSSVNVSNLQLLLFVPGLIIQIYILKKYAEVRTHVQNETIAFYFNGQNDSF